MRKTLFPVGILLPQGNERARGETSGMNDEAQMMIQEQSSPIRGQKSYGWSGTLDCRPLGEGRARRRRPRNGSKDNSEYVKEVMGTKREIVKDVFA